MKNVFKKNQPYKVTNFKPTRAFTTEVKSKENAVDNVLPERIGKSRQEIFDLMKILKTF